jgi:hypothetical protein
MHDDDDEPELAGYQPSETPLRSARFVVTMRVVVLLGLVALVLPGILFTYSVQEVTAQEACRRWVVATMPGGTGYIATFEFFGPGLIGWECYSHGSITGDRHLATLGLIPGPQHIPAAP